LQTRSGPQAASGPIPSLDGIRAVSVALVFFSHNGLGDVVPGGHEGAQRRGRRVGRAQEGDAH